jgi:hypothetical protein
MQKGLPKKIPGKANRKRTSGSSGDEISVHFFAFLDTEPLTQLEERKKERNFIYLFHAINIKQYDSNVYIIPDPVL